MRRSSRVAVSLFPFLDILASAIGTMALVIAGVSSILLSQANQVVDPSPHGTALEPHYVECRAEGLLLHPERTEIALDQIGAEKSAWQTLLAELRPRKEHEYVIFLIRPDGRPAFEKARSSIEGRSIRFGFEPIYSAGDLMVGDEVEEPR